MMDRKLVNQLAQLFVFGVRAIVASNTNDLGKPRDHLRLTQKQLDAILENEVLPGQLPGQVVV